MSLFRSVAEYREHLRRQSVIPEETHRVTIDVSELELNALEDLVYGQHTEEEERVLKEIVAKLWQKLVDEVDKGKE